jgi:cytoskeleton protein RodZ
VLLGVPEDEILGGYERSKQHMAEPSLVPRSRLEMMPERGRPKWPWVLGGAIAFLAAALIAAYVSENGLPWVGGAGDNAAAPAGNAAPPVDSTTSPSTGSVTIGDTATSGSNAPATPGDAASAPPPAPATATPGTTGSPTPTPAAGAAGAPATPAVLGAGQVRLQLRFKGDSWVEVFDGSGRAVLYDLGKGGTERTLTATAPLSVTLGNAAEVNIAVNGRAVAAPRQQGQVMARFSVAPDGSVR